jgi:hypothetical protein
MSAFGGKADIAKSVGQFQKYAMGLNGTPEWSGTGKHFETAFSFGAAPGHLRQNLVLILLGFLLIKSHPRKQNHTLCVFVSSPTCHCAFHVRFQENSGRYSGTLECPFLTHSGSQAPRFSVGAQNRRASANHASLGGKP